MSEFISKEELITFLAEELATKQKKADYWYYIQQDRNMSSFVLEHACEIKELVQKLGIAKEVYTKAYEIYDFRNSGKSEFNPDLKQLLKLQFEK